MALNRNQTSKQTHEAHRMNVLKNIQHRLEVARASGDQQLVQMLEAEANSIR
jgi:hypothetical protein